MPRFVQLCFLLTSLAALAACSSASEPVTVFAPGKPLSVRSQAALINATITLQEPSLERGVHNFTVELRAASAAEAPALLSAEAMMAAHGHRASAIIEPSGAGYRIEDLDLFMSGRWQVTLGVELEQRSDSVEFALDVP
jgi:hypothetical protein